MWDESKHPRDEKGRFDSKNVVKRYLDKPTKKDYEEYNQRMEDFQKEKDEYYLKEWQNHDNNKGFSKQKDVYFIKKYINIMNDYQKEEVNEDNFFKNTIALFKKSNKPNREPDFESKSGSKYWYTNEGVYRESNHWGADIRSCDWYVEELENDKNYRVHTLNEPIVAYCDFDDMAIKNFIMDFGNNNYEILESDFGY